MKEEIPGEGQENTFPGQESGEKDRLSICNRPYDGGASVEAGVDLPVFFKNHIDVFVHRGGERKPLEVHFDRIQFVVAVHQHGGIEFLQGNGQQMAYRMDEHCAAVEYIVHQYDRSSGHGSQVSVHLERSIEVLLVYFQADQLHVGSGDFFQFVSDQGRDPITAVGNPDDEYGFLVQVGFVDLVCDRGLSSECPGRIG